MFYKLIPSTLMYRFLILVFVLVVGLISSAAHALSQIGSPYLKRSPRGLLLGDAFTARADDDHTLFYNPASLGRHSGFTFHPLNATIQASNIYNDRDRFSDMPSEPTEIAERVMGYPLFVELGTVPGFKMGRFGFSAIMNVETNLYLSNAVNPMIDVNYRNDRGFVAGYGFNLVDENNQRITLGVSTKYIKREGLSDQVSLTGNRILEAIRSGGDFREVVRDMGLETDRAWGFDIGLEGQWGSESQFLTAGVAIQDVYTRFSSANEDTFPKQDPLVRAGLAYHMRLPLLTTIFSVDAHPINHGYGFERMTRVGLEIKLPSFSVLGGYSQAGFSYGAELDLKLIRIFAGFYKENMGTNDLMIRSNRALIYLSLFEFTFDV